ncbi:MAG: hypothetical protein WDO69_14685 [Pseudomonadota bacterium]
MKYMIGFCSFVFGSIFLTACGASEEAKSPSEGASTRQTLSVNGECSFQGCGAIPASLASTPKVACSTSSSGACAWSEDSAGASVSYRQCADSECPPKPAVDCPADTVQSAQTCGSENQGACVWTTVCVPPRITTPCPQADGCSGKPVSTIGVICKDGSSGGMACVTDGASCFLERDCD